MGTVLFMVVLLLFACSNEKIISKEDTSTEAEKNVSKVVNEVTEAATPSAEIE